VDEQIPNKDRFTPREQFKGETVKRKIVLNFLVRKLCKSFLNASNGNEVEWIRNPDLHWLEMHFADRSRRGFILNRGLCGRIVEQSGRILCLADFHSDL